MVLVILLNVEVKNLYMDGESRLKFIIYMYIMWENVGFVVCVFWFFRNWLNLS